MSKDNTIWWVMLWREMAPELFPWIKYHWYSVRYVYSKDDRRVLSWVTEIGLRDRSVILNKRDIKKIIGPLHKHRQVSIRPHLCNGDLGVEVICYLGKFKKPE